jgi:ribosomal protein L13
MKTFSATPSDIEHRWYIVDAEGVVFEDQLPEAEGG